ncbi:MAG: hypothetical protein II266_01725 [Clostridia bacterium]|nr:hypothetical protein [Clostridia bacterium]
MRCLNQNKTLFWYALYDTKDPMLDENGYETGQYTVKYRSPQPVCGNISAARGQTSALQFGEDESYDRTIVLDDPNFPIDEHSVLWVETAPQIDADGGTPTPWDYTVKKAARSLNSVTYAIRKVNVSG